MLFYNSSTDINGLEVNFTICMGSVDFTVDGSHDRLNYMRKHRVAITRWLLKEWEKIKSSSTYLTCVAYEGDGLGEMRSAIYTRLGFRPNKEDFDILEWGDKNRQSIQLPYSYQLEGLIVLEDVGDWYEAIPLPYTYQEGYLQVLRNEGDWGKPCYL